jgi:hypothetical protein
VIRRASALLLAGSLCLVASSQARAQGTMTAPVSIIGLLLPTITFAPPAPQIGDSAPLGTYVASYAATMPDGTAFPGKLTFGPPYFDAGGLFALTGGASGNIIVSPTGPGLAGLPTLPMTEHITLQAVPPP